MNYKELTGKSIRHAFNEFHKNNPHVYNAFSEQVEKAVRRGKTKVSAKLIINWIRWEVCLSSSDDNFKINDAFQSYYARLYIKNNPDKSGLFNMRKLRNEEHGPYMIENDGQLSFV